MTRRPGDTRSLTAAAAVDFLLIGLLVILATLEQIVERCHDADADDVVVERDVPEPAVLALGLQHHRRAFVAAAVAIGAFPVGPDRALVQDRIPQAQLEPVLQERRLAAGVDDDLGTDVAARAVRVLDAHADRAVAIEQHVEDVDALRARRRRARARSRASSDRTRCAPPARSASTRAACCPRSRTAPTACRWR